MGEIFNNNINQTASNNNNINSPSISSVSNTNNHDDNYNLKYVLMTINVTAYSLLFLVGFIGNVLVIVSIVHIFMSEVQKMKFSISASSTNVVFIYVLGLSLADLMVTCHLPFLVSTFYFRQWIYGKPFCVVYLFLENMNKILSTFILTALSWDRYLAICRPTSSRHLRRKMVAVSVVLMCFLSAVLLLSPVCLYAELFDMATTLAKYYQNDTLRAGEPTAKNSHTEGRQRSETTNMTAAASTPPTTRYVCSIILPDFFETIFTTYVFIAGYLIPLVLMSNFYVKVWLKIRSRQRKPHHPQNPILLNNPFHPGGGRSPGGGHRRNSSILHTVRSTEQLHTVSKRILLVILFYFICWTPHWAAQWITKLCSSSAWFRVYRTEWAVFSLLCYLLSYLNSSANPILYAALNRELRKSNTLALERRRKSLVNVKKNAVLLLEKHSERLINLTLLSSPMPGYHAFGSDRKKGSFDASILGSGGSGTAGTALSTKSNLSLSSPSDALRKSVKRFSCTGTGGTGSHAAGLHRLTVPRSPTAESRISVSELTIPEETQAAIRKITAVPSNTTTLHSPGNKEDDENRGESGESKNYKTTPIRRNATEPIPFSDVLDADDEANTGGCLLSPSTLPVPSLRTGEGKRTKKRRKTTVTGVSWEDLLISHPPHQTPFKQDFDDHRKFIVQKTTGPRLVSSSVSEADPSDNRIRHQESTRINAQNSSPSLLINNSNNIRDSQDELTFIQSLSQEELIVNFNVDADEAESDCCDRDVFI